MLVLFICFYGVPAPPLLPSSRSPDWKCNGNHIKIHRKFMDIRWNSSKITWKPMTNLWCIAHEKSIAFRTGNYGEIVMQPFGRNYLSCFGHGLWTSMPIGQTSNENHRTCMQQARKSIVFQTWICDETVMQNAWKFMYVIKFTRYLEPLWAFLA